MGSDINAYVRMYVALLEKGEIQVAYTYLVNYVMKLKSYCERSFSRDYSFGNVFPGYMDYTYFYFHNAFLRQKKLRFGIVLNHEKMAFELWLVGQNAAVKKTYWDILRATRWNKDRVDIPKYAVLECVLVNTPDFSDAEALLHTITTAAFASVDDILACIPE